MSWICRVGKKSHLSLCAWSIYVFAALPSAPALAAGPDLSSSTPINYANLSGSLGGTPEVAVSANGATAVLALAGCRVDSKTFCPAILYRRMSGVWVETAKLQPAASEVAKDFLTNEELAEGFGTGVAISSDGKTVFVGNSTADCSGDPSKECGVIDVYVEPASGWAEMTPSAQLTASTNTATEIGSRLLLSGDDLFAIGDVPASSPAVYEFTKPAQGWAHATVTAVLSANGGAFGIWGGSLAYDAADSTLAVCFGTTLVYIFQGTAGSFATSTQTATLSGIGGATSRVGDALSISGGVVAVGIPGPFGDSSGAVGVFVEPGGGWADMSAATAVLTPAAIGSPSLRINSGEGVVVDGDTILAASGGTQDIYVYKKPAGGWASAHEDSTVFSPTYGGPMSMAGSLVLEMGGGGTFDYANTEALLFPAAVPGAAAPGLVMKVNPIPDEGYVRTSSRIPVVVAGKGVTIEFGVQNIGDAGASDATLSIVAPTGTHGYSTDAGSCPLAGGIATCALGYIPGSGGSGGNDGTVTFTAPSRRTLFTLKASVTTPDLNWDMLDGSGSVQLLSDNPPVVPTLNLNSHNGQKLSGDVGATDADQDTLKYHLISGPLYGTGTLDKQGHYTYAPSSATFGGTDSLFYSVSDGLIQTSGYVQIALNAPVPPPEPPPAKSGGGGAENALSLFLLLAGIGLRRRACN